MTAWGSVSACEGSLQWSQQKAEATGLAPAPHQLLLGIRGLGGDGVEVDGDRFAVSAVEPGRATASA